ncbi:hypothetical protein HY994_05050 [Candidatus Micrarchaeota archaeon]|nr:hypothetical protein [Candidatus Micrarchaeota archaeon]
MTSADDSAEMVCEDCGQDNCSCGPCDGCGQMPCECAGGSCGSEGGCGSGACGCSPSMDSCGSGCGGMHGGWAKKKISVGIGLIAIAVLWYAKNTGMLNPAYFWPLVFGLAGIALMAKGIWMKHREKQCCGNC